MLDRYGVLAIPAFELFGPDGMILAQGVNTPLVSNMMRSQNACLIRRETSPRQTSTYLSRSSEWVMLERRNPANYRAES